MEPLHPKQGIRHNQLFRFLVLEFVCLILMVTDKNSHVTQPLRNALSVAALPLIKIVEWPQNIYQAAVLAVSRQQSLIEENSKLKQQLIEASLIARQSDSLNQENRRLRVLLHAAQNSDLKTSVAFVSNLRMSEQRQQIIINQGRSDGVFIGQAVIGLDGVVGQVETVEQYTAHVILVTDLTHAIPVEILRTGLRTIAYGTEQGLELREVAISADLQIDDVLVTSGFGNRYPRGLRLAKIEHIEDHQNRMFKVAQAKTFGDLARLTEVFLVWPQPHSAELTP